MALNMLKYVEMREKKIATQLQQQQQCDHRNRKKYCHVYHLENSHYDEREERINSLTRNKTKCAQPRKTDHNSQNS